MTALQCPQCGRQFNPRRKPAAAAKLRCPCGSVFRAGGEAEPADLADASAPPLGGAGSGAQAAAYAPSILASAGMRGVRRALEERADEVKPSAFLNVVLPVMLLIVGMTAQAALCLTQVRPIGNAVLLLAIGIAVQWLLLGPVLFITMLLAMKWFTTELGTVGALAGKLTALTLGPGAAADACFAAVLIVADFEPSFVVAAFAVYMNFLGWPLAILYRINVMETTAITAMNFVARAVVIFITVTIAASAMKVG